MQLTCPCCHARYPLGAALDRDAGAELLALLADTPPALARPLVAYLGLFRARTTQLGWDRAGRLAREVLALATDEAALAEALQSTVAAMDEKRQQGGFKPLANHNYLARVLESTTARSDLRNEARAGLVVQGQAPHQPAKPTSATVAGLSALEGLKR